MNFTSDLAPSSVPHRRTRKQKPSAPNAAHRASCNLGHEGKEKETPFEQDRIRRETANIVLWRQPIDTIYYGVLELIYLIVHNFKYFLTYRKAILVASLCVLASSYIYRTEGVHQETIQTTKSLFFWILYWLGLGIASSIGLGTGLHTFLLYLGPFIAQVTLAAYECGSIKFPRPPYPKQIICPSSGTMNDTLSTSVLDPVTLSFWQILWKVKLEAFCWGLGTALGELPPYFMARAARNGSNEKDEELVEFEQLLINAESKQSRNLSVFETVRYSVYSLIKRIGFFGILLCASIPNPLFDLAGITCGYFLIPFWTFFLATIIGKALIKMSVQTIFIIFLFSEHHVERIIRWIQYVPHYGSLFQAPFKEWLSEQKQSMHRKPDADLIDRVTKLSTLSKLFNWLVAAMIGYFVISIVNSLAQRHYKRTRTEAKAL